MNEAIVAGFAKIEPTEIDAEQIAKFDSEQEFVGVCVELLIEAGSYLVAAASIYPDGKEGWTRDQAIIGGSIVRLYKLVDSILDQTCKHRLEPSFILSRLHFETTVNCIYLMRNPTGENFENFVIHSMQHEGKLLDKIEQNIAERGGDELPIETRMKRSIERTFSTSQIARGTLPKKYMRDWAKINFRDRVYEVGLGHAYTAVFSGASQAVHGSWGDLFQHHLEVKDDRFIAKIDFKNPRPQYLEVIALLSATVVREFFDFLGLYLEKKPLQNILDEFCDRVKLLSSVHEEFLQED